MKPSHYLHIPALDVVSRYRQNVSMKINDTRTSLNQKHSDIKNWLGSGSINLFGRPFAGKDLQARRLTEWLGAPVISGGQILRNSDIPEYIRECLDRGELMPTRDYLRIITPFLSREEFANQPLILSMLGRWEGEEETILEACRQAEHPIRAVVLLEISEDTVIERWQTLGERHDRKGRRDDTLDALYVRLQEYRDKTLPVIEHYQSMGLLVKVDGEQPEDQVETDIVTVLHEQTD